MNAKKILIGQIHPLNLAPDLYAEVYSRALPEQIEVVMFFVQTEGVCPHCGNEKYASIREAFADLAAKVPAMAAGINVPKVVSVNHGFTRATGELLQENEWVKIWAIDGLYAQVGFHTPGVKSLTAKTLMASHSQDFLIHAYDTYDPYLHVPLRAPKHLADSFAKTVGNVYAAGDAIWSESLMVLRNMLMVKMRALLLGVDPDAEYARFLTGGCKNLPDFLKL